MSLSSEDKFKRTGAFPGNTSLGKHKVFGGYTGEVSVEEGRSQGVNLLNNTRPVSTPR